MDDGELIASWSPELSAWVLTLRFDDVEKMVRAQARITEALCGWTDEGDRVDDVETVFMGRAQVGRREHFGGEVVTLLTVTTKATMAESEQARRALLLQEQKARGQVGGSLLHQAWKPSNETIDMLEKWADEAVAVFPAGGAWRPRAKVSHVRDGFNSFVIDHGRPELALTGTTGGRAFSDFVKVRFREGVEYSRTGSNPYLHGLYRRPGAKPSWFPNIQGAAEEAAKLEPRDPGEEGGREG